MLPEHEQALADWLLGALDATGIDAPPMIGLSYGAYMNINFARFHPAGSLGHRLLTVAEVMRQGDELPLVTEDLSVADVQVAISKTPGRPGAALVDPLYEYGHTCGPGGFSITGGYVYRGCAIPFLRGWYVYADFVYFC